ncbi:1,3-beta-glucanosyltransferase [Irineochytrium annulatum]|nr:1,3-beta-glucanosyltransferase [Irineochytrium annulatum]
MIGLLALLIGSPLLVSAAFKAPIHIRQALAANPDLARRGSSDPVAVTFRDSVYTIPVTLMETVQQFHLQLDTGHGDTWFRNKTVALSKGRANGLKDQNMTQSDSYYRDSGLVKVEYEVLLGTVSLSKKMFAKNLYFGVSTSIDDGVIDDQSDGILGLGLDSSINASTTLSGDGKSSSFLDQLKLSDADRRFGIYLPVNNGGPGEITFGGHDDDRYTGEPACLPNLNGDGWGFGVQNATWKVVKAFKSSDEAVLGSGKLDNADNGTQIDGAAVDISSSKIFLDPNTAGAINSLIAGADVNSLTHLNDTPLIAVDCSVASTGPEVVFKIGNVTLVIPASAYILQYAPKVCVSAFVALSDSNILRFGGVLVSQYYTIFDKANSQICFATAKHSNSHAPPPPRTSPPAPPAASSTEEASPSTATSEHSKPTDTTTTAQAAEATTTVTSTEVVVPMIEHSTTTTTTVTATETKTETPTKTEAATSAETKTKTETSAESTATTTTVIETLTSTTLVVSTTEVVSTTGAPESTATPPRRRRQIHRKKGAVWAELGFEH